MPDAGGQDEKDDVKPRAGYTHLRKYERVDPKTGKVVFTKNDVSAVAKAGKWQANAQDITKNGRPGKGDRLTDAAGNVYTIKSISSVGSATNNPRYICEVDPPVKAAE